MKELAYLSTPYSSPDAGVREQRFKTVTQVAAALISEGTYVISPITHAGPIISEGAPVAGWDNWHEFDRTLIEHCDKSNSFNAAWMAVFSWC